MEDDDHNSNNDRQRNPRFPNNSSNQSRENGINNRPSAAQINPNNNNNNLPENFYDLVTELNQLNLSSSTNPRNRNHSSFRRGSNGLGSVNGGGVSSGIGGGLTGYGPYVDSSQIPVSYPNSYSISRYEDLQRMRLESEVRGQLGMYMHQLQGFPASASNDSLRGFNNLHAAFGLNSNSNSNSIPNELDDLYALCNRGGGHNHSLIQDDLIPSYINPIIRNGYDSNLHRRVVARSYSENQSDLAAKDQNGCRILQKIVEEGKPEEFQMIFIEMKDRVKELMVDSFGNYFIQEMFKLCNAEQITQLLLIVINDHRSFMDLCFHAYGTRAVQKLMEYLTTPEQRSLLISVLVRITVPLTKCITGNHVIQQCLKCLPIHHTKHILDVVADNCLDIATDQSGCCVMQQCVSQSKGECRIRLLSQIISNALVLSEHPYGNYVVQFIVSLKIPQVTNDILSQLVGNFVSLSMNKYSSNVVERCMKESSEDQAMQIINEIIRSKNFLTVLQDPFGNYVAQSAFEIAKGAIRQAMINLVQMHYSYLHSHPHGKRVLAKIRGVIVVGLLTPRIFLAGLVPQLSHMN